MRILAGIVLSLFVVSNVAFAATPFPLKVEQRFQTLENIGTNGNPALRVARFTYDVAIHGGTVGTRGLGVFLPANALIVQSFFYTTTQFAGATGTVALFCEDNNNIKTATDLTGITAGTITAGQSTGSAASMVAAIAARCEISATVATATQTAGKLVGFVEYMIIE